MYVSVFFFPRYKDDLTSSGQTVNRDSIKSNVFEGKGEGFGEGEGNRGGAPPFLRKFPFPLPNLHFPAFSNSLTLRKMVLLST